MQRYFFPIAFILLFLFSAKVYSQPLPSQPDELKQGIFNLKEENYEEAVEDFKKARELNPDSSITAYYLGIAYKKIQNYPEAKTHLKDALTLSPKVKEAVVELADVLYQLGEMKEALKEIEIADSQGMNTPQTTFLKGMLLLKLGMESDIVIEENIIIYGGKNYSYTKNDDGTITIEEGPLSSRKFYVANKEAKESFKKAKTLDEKLTTSSDFQIAMATMQEGDLNEARDIFKEIIIKDPNADIAQFANQYIDAITKRIKEERPYRLTAGIQYQHDSNVILKPGDVTASAGISGESDSAGIINLRGEYLPGLKAPFGLKTQYSLYQNLHGRLKNYDVQSHSIAIVPNYNLTSGSISLLTSYNLTRVDNLDYLKTLTLSPTYTFFISKTQFATGSLKYQDKKYVKAPTGADEDREGSDTNIGI
ncbi:MAG: tetratricopeptide repeat protein [Nitrospinae bacterium]|nr:tetratricopeptide repeat protein [Nitrospinota bacterium]